MQTPSAQELKQQGDRVLALLMQDFENILNNKTATPTDRATIARFLKDNNYTVDPKNLPKDLRDLMRRNGAASPLPDPDSLPAAADMAVIAG